MDTTAVTSKGQVTIPIEIRQRLGIRKGTKIEFVMAGDRVELKVKGASSASFQSGFGMLKSPLKPVPVDVDPAKLVKP